MKSIKKLFSKFKTKVIGNLETVEEKSFWIVAPLVIAFGITGLFTTGSYETVLPTFFLAFLCLIIPISLMIFVSIKKNYHYAYPILCILIGALSIPVTFVTSGGFMSGMPVFCAATTAITALCYYKKWRIFSFITCVLGNTAAFIYVYLTNPDLHILGSEILFGLGETEAYKEALMNGVHSVYNDILLGYYCTSLGLFLCISFVVSDISKYKINNDTLQKYFDIQKRNEIFKQVINPNGDVKAEHKRACILFADISNFTPITEKMSSDLISEFLNDFFTLAGKYIHETGGIIDKYIGDCVMAYWLDTENENCVLKCVQAMLNLKIDLYAQSEKIFAKYGTELNFSVGIAYGDVIFGDIGSDTMHDYTVIGDAVNTASRIQSDAVSGEILISDEAAEKIKDKIIIETVEINHFFKGKNRPVDLYRVVGIAKETKNVTLNEKDYYGYKLTICGCRGSFPVSGIRFHEYGGETSCYVIKKDDYALIVDCGTGLKNAAPIISDCKKIDILLTHVHYDHILGLLMTRFPKDCVVNIFGNFNAWDGYTTLEKFMEHPYWPVDLTRANKVNINVGEEIKLNNDFKATFFPSDHPDEACVIKVMCKDKKLAFLADCENANIIDPSVTSDAEIVFFDGMFDDDDVIDHKGWGHGTWQDGIRFLENKNIKRLIITHHNPELGDRTLMKKEIKARELNQKVSFAKTGDIYNI